jgi:hypothetical protein
MPAMPSARQLKHTRSIRLEVYARDDGLWDIEAHLTDIKTRNIELASGIRAAGEPLHDMLLTLTIDQSFNILEADSKSIATPYPGTCESINPAYRQLVGLNLLKGFRHAVRERLGGIQGCTHLTELAAVLPTAAVQGFAGEQVAMHSAAEQPFQLNHCHALRTDGDAVREFYPRWYVGDKPTGISHRLPFASPTKESNEDS